MENDQFQCNGRVGLRKPKSTKLKGYRLAKAGCRQDGRQAATKGGCH